jgi:hypothetical protein
MWTSIIHDFLDGLLTSIRFDYVFNRINSDIKLKNIFYKIIRYNAFMHLVPYLLIWIIESLLDVKLDILHSGIYLTISLIAALFQILHFLDITNIVSVYVKQINYQTSNTHLFDPLSMTLTMSVYQFAIYLMSCFISLIFDKNTFFGYLANVIVFAIYTLYHSFYAFNNLWQHKKIDIYYRIDIFQKLWPYYIGYGTLSSILLMMSGIEYPFNTFIYHSYLLLLVMIPFCMPSIKNRYPKKSITYFEIDLSFFSYLTRLLLRIISKICMG